MDADEYDAYGMDDPKSPGYAERILASADDRRNEQLTGGI
jgi:hypothetical protein